MEWDPGVRLDRLPLGTVAAIEFLPVIVLAGLGARTSRNALALLLAVAGVYRSVRAFRESVRVAAIILIKMERVVVLGRGAAGKSTASVRMGQITGLPVIELDQHFWRPGLAPMPSDEWTQLQHVLAAGDRWIMDGDLGPYDALGARLARADTVLIFDFSLARCAWRAARRSRESADFWRWLLTWRHRHRNAVLDAVSTFAAGADLYILRTPRHLCRFLSTIS